jgi:hypothetical protein
MKEFLLGMMLMNDFGRISLILDWEEIHFLDCSGQMLLMICSTLAVMKFE